MRRAASECFDQKSVSRHCQRALEFLPALRITIKIKNRGEKDRLLLFHVPAEFEHIIKKFDKR
jgi:hypothetical protein